MGAENTKEKIALEALRLFAQQGYEQTSMADIAHAVGIKAPSIYNHYPGKQAIFDAILENSQEGYARHTQMSGIHYTGPDSRERILSMTEEDQIEAVRKLFAVTLHTESPYYFHKLMECEQRKSPKLVEEYNRRFIDGPIREFTYLMQVMMDGGVMKTGDAKSMAMQYVLPISILLESCFRQPEREAETLEMVAAHIRQFNRAYRINH